MDIKMIKEVVMNDTKIDLNNPEINNCRRADYVEARMLYFVFCREFTKMGLSQIGNTLEPRKNHATVLHSIRQFENWSEKDKSLQNKYNKLKAKMRYVIDVKNEMDIVEALTKLQDLESNYQNCMMENQRLSNQINELNEKIEKQNKYLVENYGYDVTRSVFGKNS